MPMVLKKRRNATPRTMCGIISGDSRNADSASRPGKRVRAIASAAGTASRSPGLTARALRERRAVVGGSAQWDGRFRRPIWCRGVHVPLVRAPPVHVFCCPVPRRLGGTTVRRPMRRPRGGAQRLRTRPDICLQKWRRCGPTGQYTTRSKDTKVFESCVKCRCPGQAQSVRPWPLGACHHHRVLAAASGLLRPCDA